MRYIPSRSVENGGTPAASTWSCCYQKGEAIGEFCIKFSLLHGIHWRDALQRTATALEISQREFDVAWHRCFWDASNWEQK